MDERRKNIKVVECNHQGATFTDGKCERCGFICTKHEYDVNTEACKICGQKIVVNDGTNYYVSLSEAFERVEDGDEISVLTDLPEESATFFGENGKTATLCLNGRALSSKTGSTLSIAGGELTVINGIEGSTVVNDPIVIKYVGTEDYGAIAVGSGKLVLGSKLQANGLVNVTGGTIEFKQAAELNQSLKVKNGTIEGGLPVGSILKKGNATYSVSVDVSIQYNNVQCAGAACPRLCLCEV